jgi:hypothetical protein
MLRTAAICFFAASTVAPQDAPATIAWEPDLATALAKSKSDGKPAIAYFTFDT